MSLTTPQARRLRSLIDALVETQVDAAFSGSMSTDEATYCRAGATLAEAKLNKYIEQLLVRRT